MTAERFDIWLHAIAPTAHEPAAAALGRVFGISVAAAEELIASLPRVVKRDASAEQTQRILAVLYAVGARAEAVAHERLATWHAEPEGAALQLADERPRDPLALAASPPPVPKKLRAPSERARDPERRMPVTRATPARLDVRGLVDPVHVALEILNHAERSSWQNALRGHPVAGFLIVMLATTSAFLLVYAMM